MFWLKQFLQQLGMKQESYMIHYESQSALDLSKNVMYHSLTNHIDVRYHLLQREVEEQHFKLEKIHIDKNPTNMMSKVVAREKLQLCGKVIDMDCL